MTTRAEKTTPAGTLTNTSRRFYAEIAGGRVFRDLAGRDWIQVGLGKKGCGRDIRAAERAGHAVITDRRWRLTEPGREALEAANVKTTANYGKTPEGHKAPVRGRLAHLAA